MSTERKNVSAIIERKNVSLWCMVNKTIKEINEKQIKIA